MVAVAEIQHTSADWTERALQNALYIHCALKNHEIIVPNSCVFGWESDMVSVTRAGLITEYEVKITVADFRKDAGKARASILINPTYERYGKTLTHRRPNYFYYVVPDGLIKIEDVPEYAGLIYVRTRGMTREIKAPTRIHREKLDDWQRRQLERALTIRYWKQRLKTNGAETDGEGKV